MKTIAIDFDGVLNEGEWTGIGEVNGPPHPDVARILRRLGMKYKIVVHTCRAAHYTGILAVANWLAYHGIRVDDITDTKPYADLYVDDKAYRFKSWEELEEDLL